MTRRPPREAAERLPAPGKSHGPAPQGSSSTDGLPFCEADAVGAPASKRVLRSQGRRTMRKLLDAAMVAFDKRGYHATRVNDVVEIAKTSHGTFYLYFSNKEDLLRALVTEAATEAQHLYDALRTSSPERRRHPQWEDVHGWICGLLASCGSATPHSSGPGPIWPPSTPSCSMSSVRRSL